MATGILKSYEAEGNHTYVGAHWFVEWRSEKISNGLTQVKWRLAKGGRTTTSRWVQTQARLYFTSDVTISYVDGDNFIGENNQYNSGLLTTSTNARFDEPEKTIKQGTFNIKHNDAGEGSFFANFQVAIDATNINNLIKNKQEAILENNVPYTKCPGPRTVSIKERIQKPGGTITVSWDKVASSASNIKGYRVQYKIGSGSWTNTPAAGISDSSKTITIPENAKRGAIVLARVCSIHSVNEDYNSSYVESGVDCTINKKPSEPKVTITDQLGNKTSNPLKIPYGSSRIISCKAGDSNNSDQDAKVYYSVGNGEKQEYTREIIVNSSKNYVFYTSDGLEYSDGVEKTFVYNSTLPTIIELEASGDSLDSKNNKSGLDYVINPKITVTETSGGQSDDNTYTFSLWVSTSQNANYTVVKTLQSDTNKTCTIEDIRVKYAPNYSEGYYYKIGVVRNDGIEDSEMKFTEAFFVTKIPTCLVTVDDKNESEVTTNTTQYFSNKIKIDLDRDEGYTEVGFQLLDAVNNSIYPEDFGSKSRTISNLSSIPRGSKYTVRVRPKGRFFTPRTTQKIGNIFKILLPKLGAPSLGDSKLINPYTSSSKNLAFLNFFNTTPSPKLLKEYGCEKKAMLMITALGGTTPGQIEVEYDWNESEHRQDTYYLPITNKNYQDLFNNLTIINKNSTSRTKVDLKLSFTTVHGDMISAPFTQDICYVTEGTTPVIGQEPFLFSGYWSSLNDAEFLCEKCKIDLTGIKLSNIYHDISKVQVQIGSDDFSTIIFDGESLLENIGPNEAKEGFRLPTFALPQIKKDLDDNYIRIRITSLAGQTSAWQKQKINLPIRKLLPGDGSLINPSWDEKGKVGLSFKCTDLGYTPDIKNDFTARLYYDPNTAAELNGEEYFWNHNKFNETNQVPLVKRIDFSPSGWSNGYKQLMVKCTSQLFPNGSDGPSVVWYTPILVIYQASPTLSYRKNYVGINCTFDDNALTAPVFAIKAHQGQNKIYFVNADQKITIDLVDMSVDGVVLDGGTWQ